jgi:hypothetical protein
LTTLSAAVLLFLVIDPVGNIPVFLSLLSGMELRRARAVIVRELLIALGVLVAFLFFGRYLLQVLHVTEPALSISGGIILFLIALKMIFAEAHEIFGKAPDGEPFVVPLAVPLRIDKTITVGFGLLVRNANGVGSRFRATASHMEDASSENDSRPRSQNATLIHLPVLSALDADSGFLPRARCGGWRGYRLRCRARSGCCGSRCLGSRRRLGSLRSCRSPPRRAGSCIVRSARCGCCATWIPSGAASNSWQPVNVTSRDSRISTVPRRPSAGPAAWIWTAETSTPRLRWIVMPLPAVSR